MRSTECPKEMDEGDCLFPPCLWLVDYSHSETDLMAMPIINNEESKSFQISNSWKLLLKVHDRTLASKKTVGKKKQTLGIDWLTLGTTRFYSKQFLMKFPYFINVFGEPQDCFLVEKRFHSLLLQKYNIYSL